jgi:signal transduction histidine kinase
MDRLLLLKRRIRFGYLLSFLLLLFSFCLIFYVQQRLVKESEWVIHSYEILNNTESLKAELTAAETGMRGYLITQDTRFLKPYNDALKTVPLLCDKLKTLTADNNEQQSRIDTLEHFIRKRINILSAGLTDFQTNGFNVTDEMKRRLDSGMYAMDSARMHITNFRIAEERLMQTRKERLSGFFNGARMMAIISMVIVFFALLYSIITFNRAYRAKEEADKIAKEYKSDLESNKNELKEKNIELKELKDLEKFTSTGRIARTIAHEVRNPLTNILLATDQLRENDNKNEESTVLLELINRNAGRINQLVSDLLNATRFSHLDFAEINVNQLMEETLELAKDRLDLNQIRVEKKYSPEVCAISVDKEKMKVALLNIIVNAIEAMENGKGILQLATRKQGNKCVIEIGDNGKGMDEEILQNIFEPYFTSKLKGNGLGLTNTQNIILNHHASISVYSKPGSGTVFLITLDVLTKNEATE